MTKANHAIEILIAYLNGKQSKEIAELIQLAIRVMPSDADTKRIVRNAKEHAAIAILQEINEGLDFEEFIDYDEDRDESKAQLKLSAFIY